MCTGFLHIQSRKKMVGFFVVVVVVVVVFGGAGGGWGGGATIPNPTRPRVADHGTPYRYIG